MKKSLLVVALVTFAFPAICSATPPRLGPYVSGFAGISVLRDTDATTTDFAIPATFNERVEFDPGIYVGGTGGFDFGVIRLEGELSYKHGEMKTVTDQFDGTRFVNVDGSLGALAMMFNAFFDLHNASPVTPYLGGGAGFAVLHLSDTFATNTSTGGYGQLYQDDDDAVFAYQAGAGLEIALNQLLSLDLGYRYFGTSRASFDKNWPTTTDLKFESHNGAVGLRVKF